MVAKPVIVGLLGGIASGKSAVADLLARRGARRIDADGIAHEVLSSPDIVPRIVELLGTEALDADGRPDRREIGKAVFGDPGKLRALEALVHPRVRERIRKEIGAAADAPVVVVDAPLLLEGGLAEIADVLVFVVAPTQARIDRARAQRGWDAGELSRREALQAPLEEKEARARLTIVNDGTLEDLDRRVETLWERLREEGLPGKNET